MFFYIIVTIAAVTTIIKNLIWLKVYFWRQ